MPILDLYEHGGHRKNLAHFATLVSLATIDNKITPAEKAILDKFAFKLNISEAEYKEVLKEENHYPIVPPASAEKRHKRLFDFFQIIFSNHEIDTEERDIVERYAIGLGFPPKMATEVIEKSIAILTGQISFEEYYSLVHKKH